MEHQHYREFVAAAKDDRAYKIFCHNAELGSRRYGVPIDHIKGRSEEILPDLPPNTFDIVYVDAGHYYDDVIVDIEFAKNLVVDGGIICGDDLNLILSDTDLEVTKANANRDYIRDERSGWNYHPGVTLAVGESFPAVGTADSYWSVRKTSDQTYLPSEMGFNGFFMPSFLSHDAQKSFVAMMQPVSST